MKNMYFTYFHVRKGLSTDDVGVARGHTVFPEIRLGADFKTGDFVNRKVGGLP